MVRPHLGRDTSASGTWFADWHRGRIGELLFRQHMPVEKAKKAGVAWGLEGGDALKLGKALRPRWVGCSKSRKISVRF